VTRGAGGPDRCKSARGRVRSERRTGDWREEGRERALSLLRGGAACGPPALLRLLLGRGRTAWTRGLLRGGAACGLPALLRLLLGRGHTEAAGHLQVGAARGLPALLQLLRAVECGRTGYGLCS